MWLCATKEYIYVKIHIKIYQKNTDIEWTKYKNNKKYKCISTYKFFLMGYAISALQKVSRYLTTFILIVSYYV